jgi:hypothetical protein
MPGAVLEAETARQKEALDCSVTDVAQALHLDSGAEREGRT